MGKNSIQSNLTKDDLIAEIRLTLGADFKREHTVIIVEGEDDISFFNGKLSSNVDIRESFSGKRGVLEIVSLFSDSRVIGVCDVDYDTGTPSPQILYYDYSCLEMIDSHTTKAGLPVYLTRYAPVLRHGILISPHEEKHFRPALAGGKCFLSPRIHAIFRGGHIFIFLFRFCSAIISLAKSALCGRAFGSHPYGRTSTCEFQSMISERFFSEFF